MTLWEICWQVPWLFLHWRDPELPRWLSFAVAR